MWIDPALLILIALGTLSGWLSGGIAQALRLFAAIAAIAVAAPLADLLAPLLLPLPLPIFLRRIVALVTGAVAFYAVLSLLIGAGVRLVHSSSKTLGSADRALGAVLGLLKGCAFAAAFAWLLIRAQPLDDTGSLAATLDRSLVLRAWAEHRDELIELGTTALNARDGSGSGDGSGEAR
jgi:uncharacterized membrane protein required for colicin V production